MGKPIPNPFLPEKTKKKDTRKTVTVKLPKEIYVRLRLKVEARRTSMNEYLNALISDHVVPQKNKNGQEDNQVQDQEDNPTESRPD